MRPLEDFAIQSRRSFLTSSASGLGAVSLASLLAEEGLLESSAQAASVATPTDNPLTPKPPHFAPKAKNCILIYLEGGPSQIDLFDQKPKLTELHGQPLPKSMTDKVRFAFIQKESAVLMGCKRKFAPAGQCGMELSNLLPNIATHADDICLVRSMHTEAFNHHPGQILMHTGVTFFGRPTMGSWLVYGLGSESKNLPGYVVLTSGRGTSGGATNWSSGFLPSTYQGVLFRNQGEPILNLANPAGLSSQMQRVSLDAINDLNRHRFGAVGDPEIASRVASYELAFRMQSAAPELIDLGGESKATLDAYGVGRSEGTMKNYTGDGKGEFNAFSTNCLLARRLIERGTRCVSLYHATWDHHANLDVGLEFNCKMADQPVAALLKDLKTRGLLDSTLVIWLSEFGRTPLGENRKGRDSNTGRDHHPFAFSIWMAGGGVRGGYVHGATDDIGWNVERDPVHVNDLHATIMRLFGFDHTKLTVRYGGLDVRLTNVAGKVVDALIA